MPKVANGFARFVVRPASAGLLLPGIQWLWSGIQLFDDRDWKERNLEDNLVGVLHEAWERRREEVSNEPSLRQPFLGLLMSLTSRGGHATAALRERVIESIGMQ